MAKHYATAVIDLCDDRDPPAAESVAKMPNSPLMNENIVSLLDDDDDDDDNDETGTMQPSWAAAAAATSASRKRQRIKHRAPFAKERNVSLRLLDDDRKPAAIVTAERKGEEEVTIVSSTPSTIITPLARILEVFPDVRVQHALSLLEQTSSDIPQVLSMLGEGSYPKEEQATKTVPAVGTALVHREGATEFLHDYLSTSSFVPSARYRIEAIEQLLHDFPFLSKSGAKNLFANAQNHYAVAHKNIREAILGGPLAKNEDQQEVQYRLWKSAVSGVPLTATQEASLKPRNIRGKMTLVSPRRKNHVSAVTDVTLQDEIRFVSKKTAEWETNMKDLLQRKRAREKSIKEGSCLTCSCCFDEVAFEEMISCRQAGHLFCIDCVRRFAESQIFGAGNFGIDPTTKRAALELLCMSGEGCASGFDRSYLEKALSGKVLEKYDQLAFHASVNAAGIGDSLCSCPNCGYEADLPETQMLFQCPVAECGYESCRKCGLASHIPMRCDEVERDKIETKGRVRVEEAITEAKIRTCPTPKCGTKFVKSDGCNKMTCSKCGNWSCYVCREAIPKSIGYKHFCQKFECSHANCNGCPLYTNTEEDDKRAMREAGMEAAERVCEESRQTEGNGGSKPASALEVRVDVDSLLR